MFGSFHSVAMLCVSLMLAFTSAAASPTPLLISQPYYSFFYFPYGRYDTAVFPQSLWNPDSNAETLRTESSEIEGRTPVRKVFTDHSSGGNFASEMEGRLSASLRNAISNFPASISSPLSSFFNNPGLLGLLDGTPCTSPNAEAGICTNSRLCSSYGGRSSGSCSSFGSVCCINTVTRCGATVTLNNTYWQAPTTLSAESTCSLSIQLNPTLAEQRRNPICQVRLDFEAFSIAGPNTQTVCATDNFRVSGTANRIPIICGQNVGQHMYLIAPSSTADIQLIFTLGTGTAQDRSWKIRTSLLACSSTSLLAPEDCLQYFTQSSGTVRSFNWREVSPSAAAPRQLANQDYNICFRTEQIINTNSFPRVASSICYTPCVITTTAVPPQMPPLAFSLTADSSASFLPAGAGAGTNFNQCANTDYLVIHGAVDSTMPTSFNDRFCGNNLNPASQTTSVTLCSTAKPFNIFYRTDGSESNTEFANNGFCLRYEQRAS
ncbi:uncharacterized protein LOC116920739 [Daphnia magna]|uniref:CUB domain-containing protein n=1 Tax=Daphnia magna TaxID=35525 RepID=A0ABQ9ZD71_9CRUS|nr:uncharacterized protein LOC116920739 [Daphnia magna]KAK4010495.1 hypothetical protein OUZ56_019638 [Daphnia magna]